MRLQRLGIEGEKGEWKVGIVALGRRSRTFRWGGRREVEVRRDSWEEVMRGFAEGRLVGLKVDCWRD